MARLQTQGGLEAPLRRPEILTAATFLNNNRNKRSLALDLKQPRGKAVLLALAQQADVLMQNFRPGVVNRLGVGYATVQAVNPRLVYVSMSGFGEQGPYAHKPVYDPLIQALSGLTTIQAGGDDERPRLVRTIVPDKVTGLKFICIACQVDNILCSRRLSRFQITSLPILY